MKNKQGFTLIELLAIIILLGLIAIIVTPKITKVLKTQKMNLFEESIDGLIKAVKEDAINNISFNSTSTSNYRAYVFDETGLYLTVAGNKAADADIKIGGSIDNGEGTVVVTENSDIVFAIYNDKFCAKKNADDQSFTVEDFTGSCVNAEIDLPEISSCYIYESNPDNTLTITDYDYANPVCSKDLVIPNRINGKKVSKIADFAFVDAEVIIAEYIEKDAEGNQHWYDEFLQNFPEGKSMEWVGTTSTSNVTGKFCYTDVEENNSVIVDLNYVHTTGDGYYSCYYNYTSWPNASVNNYKFKSIDFSKATGITEIPVGLVVNSTLESVNIGEYITKINSLAFQNNIINNLIISKSIQQINSYAFLGNSISNLDFSNASSLINIGEGAFVENHLETVIIENLNNLVSIDGGNWGAFEYNNLVSVSLKNLPKLTHLGDIDDECGVFRYNSISIVDFENLPNLITYGTNTFGDNSLTEVVLPDSLLTIGDYSFAHNSISAVTFSSGLSAMGEGAFYQNEMTSVTIPSSITVLEEKVFSGNLLTTISIPNSITSIGPNAFSYNTLTSVLIPSGVTSIGFSAFYENQLPSITIPNSVINIGYSAFEYNNLLQGNATIDNTAGNVTLGTNIFNNNGVDRITIITPVFLR